LHRWRGVKIGSGVWIGYDAIIETSFPDLVTIESGVTISTGVIITAHFHEQRGVTIEENVFIGPGAIIMPNVTIGQGAVVTAGTVVSRSVPAMTMVQGNPAKVIAKLGIPLTTDISLKEFLKHLKNVE